MQDNTHLPDHQILPDPGRLLRHDQIRLCSSFFRCSFLLAGVHKA